MNAGNDAARRDPFAGNDAQRPFGSGFGRGNGFADVPRRVADAAGKNAFLEGIHRPPFGLGLLEKSVLILIDTIRLDKVLRQGRYDAGGQHHPIGGYRDRTIEKRFVTGHHEALVAGGTDRHFRLAVKGIGDEGHACFSGLGEIGFHKTGGHHVAIEHHDAQVRVGLF